MLAWNVGRQPPPDHDQYRCLAARHWSCLAARHMIMKARDVNRRIERLGGSNTRTRGSHRMYEATANGVTARTTVPQHSGDIPVGTLHAIEKDMEPAFGKGWLK